MNALIAGAGAIGQWLGARLQAAGHDVTLLVRPRFRDAIAKDGLIVHGHTQFDGPVACVTTLAEAGGDFDAAVITAKAFDTAALASVVAPSVAADGVLASLQNGLGNGEKLARAVSPDRVAVGLTSHGVEIEAPGRIRHAGTGVTKVGPLAEADAAAARRLHGLLRDAGLAPQWCDPVRPHVWQKAVVNAAINPIGALHGVRNGDILADAALRRVSEDAAAECAGLADAAGVALPSEPWGTVQDVLRGTAANRCSMLQDVASERPTEIEQITGRLVRLGLRLGVEMPVNHDLYGRVKALESSYLGVDASARLTEAEVAFESDPF